MFDCEIPLESKYIHHNKESSLNKYLGVTWLRHVFFQKTSTVGDPLLVDGPLQRRPQQHGKQLRALRCGHVSPISFLESR